METGPCSWPEWTSKGKDEAIAPTLDLYRLARSKGVAVFFITGRHEGHGAREATEKNLRKAGYDDFAGLSLEPADMRVASAACYKTPERAKIEQRGYTIILNVGDQQSDLAGGHAERTFKLPNPFYYIP
jgi:acid phosphatase